ncbi:MAG: diacylglycerol kinase [Gammaproteobacteria bacterium]|nr:diacylglycerol kinase [Gammaproteobacteria bacterium]
MKKNTGIKRLFCASLYSWQGFRSALANESAFRQEFVAAVILVVLSLYLDVTGFERLAMISSLALILIVELLNSAIECVVDRVSMDRHTLSGRAKDYGSFAVLITLLIAIATWALILVN